MPAFVQQLHKALSAGDLRDALVVGSERWSFEVLSKKIAAIHEQLQQHAAAQTRIALVNRADAQTYAALLACWFSGRAYVPIEPTLPDGRIAEIIAQAGLTCVLDSTPYLAEGALASLKQLDSSAASDAQLTLPVIDPDAEAYILFTSGSTGKPKGVPITFGNLNALVVALQQQAFDFGPTDRWLQMASLSFDLSILSLLPCWLNGGCLCVPVSEDQPKYLSILELIEREQLTVLPMVPTVLKLLRPFSADIQLPQVRYTILGGEPFPAALAHEWRGCFPNAAVYNFYGPTEGAIVTSIYKVQAGNSNQSHEGILAIGQPLAAMQIQVLGSEADALGQGELCIAGPQVFRAYLQADAPLYTDQENTWYRTGDRVQQLPDGNLLFLGRIDRQVQIEGHRTEPGELEAVATALLEKPCCAVAVTNERFATARLLLIVKTAVAVPEAALARLRGHLPAHLHPFKVLTVANFPVKQSTDGSAVVDLAALQAIAEAEIS